LAYFSQHTICTIISYLTIFLNSYNSKQIKLGDYLGDLTNELIGYGPDAYIDEFISGGPKNYVYRISNGLHIIGEILKIRGIKLTYEICQTLNFDLVKKLIYAYVTHNPIIKKIYEKKLIKNNDRSIYSSESSKNYQIVFCKRKLFKEFESRPFGFLE